MKVNCVCCGHNLELDDAYNDFEGLFKCYVCGALLELKTHDGKIKSVNRVESQPAVKRTGVDLEEFL